MPEAQTVFAEWSNFYVIIGSSAAALTGLMFVVVTLVAGDRSEPVGDPDVGFGTFSTPTVMHFVAASLGSGMLSAPWRSPSPVAVLLGLAGLGGVVYMLRVIGKARRLTTYQPDREDWTWFAILPLAAYLAIAATALLLRTNPTEATFVVAAATMLLIFIGIRNAWDVVTYLALGRNTKQ